MAFFFFFFNFCWNFQRYLSETWRMSNLWRFFVFVFVLVQRLWWGLRDIRVFLLNLVSLADEHIYIYIRMYVYVHMQGAFVLFVRVAHSLCVFVIPPVSVLWWCHGYCVLGVFCVPVWAPRSLCARGTSPTRRPQCQRRTPRFWIMTFCILMVTWRKWRPTSWGIWGWAIDWKHDLCI